MNLQNNTAKQPLHLSDFLWDLWCVVSIVGIWPRFIEPNIISTTKLNLKIPNLPTALENFKIVQFSDLHLNKKVSQRFLDRLIAKTQALKPDLIVFTGDFLCYSHLDDKERLLNFLKAFKAPYGCYAILGNHDYNESVSINDKGEYDILKEDASMIKRGLSRLFTTTTLAKKSSADVQKVDLHQDLLELLKQTPFTLLHNETKKIPIKDAYLNVCGLGEYMLGRTLPEKAFKNYDANYPGIVLLHNPDGVPLLQNYPGDIVLCGHTHGGQINLPWMWKKFTLLENMQFKKGLVHSHNKLVYVNKGLGGVMKFRWFAVPEILELKLVGAS